MHGLVLYLFGTVVKLHGCAGVRLRDEDDDDEEDCRMKMVFAVSHPSDDSNQRRSDVLRSHS